MTSYWGRYARYAQVQEALALGADPNKRGIDGSTALMQVREDISM